MRAALVSPAARRGSADAAGTLVQRPGALGNAQNTHLPWQVESQQTPSTQLPDPHSAALLQTCPNPFFPQLLDEHELGATHCRSPMQLSLQAPSAHKKGAQVMGAPLTQLPVPSHTLGGIRLATEQAPSRQMVPAANFEHPPWPLQTPLCPQVSDNSRSQTLCGSVWPTGTGVHWPIRPTSLQLTHAPVQPTLQQIPSAQKPDSHSAVAAQTAPSGFFPHWPALQASPAHCPSVLHWL